MPGEPFGMAQTQDGTAIAVTHQTSTDTSLLTAGEPPATGSGGINPSMQFVRDRRGQRRQRHHRVPHDPDSSVPPCGQSTPPARRPLRQPAFLETDHDTAELDLLRYYNDDGSSLHRPFLAKEAVFAFTTNIGGTDSRGIAIDSTPRMACKAMRAPTARDVRGSPGPRLLREPHPAVARLRRRSAAPPRTATARTTPTSSRSSGNLPLPAGPSTVYVAPIVNAQGNYEVRVFVVNFDSSTISVYDPNQRSNLALVRPSTSGPDRSRWPSIPSICRTSPPTRT